MKQSQNVELVILGTAAIGSAWIQIPIVAFMVFTFAIFIVPVLIFLLMWCLNLALQKKEKDRNLGRKGLLLLGLLAVMPMLSIETVDFFRKMQAEKLIMALEEYKHQNGCYPTDLSATGSDHKYQGFHYAYSCPPDAYSVAFSNGALSGSIYHSRDSSWKRDFLH